MYKHASWSASLLLLVEAQLFVLIPPPLDSRGINRIEGLIRPDAMVSKRDGGVECGVSLRIDIRIVGAHAFHQG